jgi:hypothetical protein
VCSSAHEQDFLSGVPPVISTSDLETDVAGALALRIKDAWKSIGERIDSPLHSAPVEASSDPLFGLVARLEAYSEIVGQVPPGSRPLCQRFGPLLTD